MWFIIFLHSIIEMVTLKKLSLGQQSPWNKARKPLTSVNGLKFPDFLRDNPKKG